MVNQRSKRNEGQAEEPLLRCVWMTAGVVNFRLCDRRGECETCLFDQAMRGATGTRETREQSGQGGDRRRGLVRVVGSALADFDAPACEVASDLFFETTHAWARIEDGGVARVGLDDFGQQLAGPIYRVRLPKVGDRLTRTEPAWSLTTQFGEIEMTTPVEGDVTWANAALEHMPSAVNRDPYGRGAAFCVAPTDLGSELTRLLYGTKAAAWTRSELDALTAGAMEALSGVRSELGPTAADGGSPCRDLFQVIHAEPALYPLIRRHLSRNLAADAVRQLSRKGEH